MSALALVVDGLAAYRLTRLVTEDVLTDPLREAAIAAMYDPHDRGGADTWQDRVAIDGADAPRLAYLLTCRWCAGVWVAAGVVAARRLAPRAWAPVADTLAVAAAAALVARLED